MQTQKTIPEHYIGKVSRETGQPKDLVKSLLSKFNSVDITFAVCKYMQEGLQMTEAYNKAIHEAMIPLEDM